MGLAHNDKIIDTIEMQVYPKLFNIVFQEVRQASVFVKSQFCRCRCTAIPLDNIDPRPVQKARINLLHQYNGIHVNELIRIRNPHMQKIADQLFGNLAIAPTLQDARKIAYDQ